MPDFEDWPGQTLYDSGGDKIGSTADVYFVSESGEPDWITVKTGRLSRGVTFVPVRGATVVHDGIRAGYDKALVKDAPSVEADDEVSAEEARRLYAHYALDSGEGADFAGGDGAMTRSEEELHVVGTERVPAGRARLRKYIVVEEVQVTVPVRREELRVEFDVDASAISDGIASGPPLTDNEVHEVTLYAEEPVVEKRVVPRERVRVAKQTVIEERVVTDELRKEQSDTEYLSTQPERER